MTSVNNNNNNNNILICFDGHIVSFITSFRCVWFLTHLEVDPGLQLSAAVEETQQTGACDAVGAARHEATPTCHPAEDTVFVVT